MDLSPEDAKFLRELQHRMLREAIIEQQTGMSAIDPLRYKRASLNRPGFPGECFICELRLPDHRFRWKHN
ncbi:hypothetical protein, partial [Escherichia coli]|uniref:hypothetical protein n=1 Tax=Escherichia coli TaxID=562 RepID=UPI0024B8389F